MLTLEILPGRFSICRLDGVSQADMSIPYSFLSVTDGEVSLVCPEEAVPAGIRLREDGFVGFRVAGTMELDLIGILAQLSAVLAKARVGIFAVSTFDTDYILVREENWDKASAALEAQGYVIR